MRTKKRIITGIAAASAAALALTGCSGDTAAETLENGDQADVTIAVFNGWDEGIAASELWKAILTEQGYNVELEYADPAPVFSGLSTGDYDVTLDTWLPITHSDFVEEYQVLPDLLNANNLMMRKDGTLVFSDPVFIA